MNKIMHILIVSFFSNWGNVSATEAELVKQHLIAGDSVSVLMCDGSIGSCVVNPKAETKSCQRCQQRRVDNLKGVVFHHIKAQPIKLPTFKTPTEIKVFQYKGADLGAAALSSANTRHRDPICDSDHAMTSANKYLQAACRSYEATIKILEADNFGRVYNFNGRFAESRGAWRAAQAAGVPCFNYDRGCSVNHYQLFSDTLPHDAALFQRRVKQAWANRTDNAEQMADEFYEDQRRGGSARFPGFPNLVAKQIADKLPNGWNGSRRNVVVFTSSEDELAAIEGLIKPSLYHSQAEAITRLATDSDCHFYVRIHPNLFEASNESLSNIEAIDMQNVTIIRAADRVDSYAMLEACDSVLTFGSTMGIEATYYGKPSVLISGSFYDELGSTHNATSHNDALALIQTNQLADRLGAVMFGYYKATFGIIFS